MYEGKKKEREGKKRERERETCESIRMICDHQGLIFYPVPISLHRKYFCEVCLQTASCVPLESLSMQVTVRPCFLWVEILALSMTRPCCQYDSTQWNCWEHFVDFSKKITISDKTLFTASWRSGSHMLRNIKITDIYWNLNLMFFCIAAHRMVLYGVHLHNQET